MLKYKHLLLFVFIFLFTFSGNTAIETASAATIDITQPDGTTYSQNSGSLKIIYKNATINNVVLPPVQINSVWMVSLEEVFKNGLNCQYVYNEETGEIIIKSPAGEKSVYLTLGSTEATDMTDTFELEISPLLAKNIETGEQGIIVPVENVLDILGYDAVISSNNLTITTYMTYYKRAADASYDETIYNNVLSGVVIKKLPDSSSLRTVETVTGNTCKSADVSFQVEAESNAVTIKLSKTKNAIGNIEKSFASGSVTKIKLWETDDYITCLKVWFNPKYQYTKKKTGIGAILTSVSLSFSLKIVLPQNVSFEKVTTTDQYWNKRFVITIPGNHVSYYKTNKPLKNSSRIKKYTVAKSGKNTKITVNTTKLQGYKLTKKDGYFIVTVDEPKKIYKYIILLDAGHGGKDSGAVSYGVKEKNLNLSIIYDKAKAYFEDNSSPVKAYWTRHNDTFVNLYQRPKLVKEYQADLFISLHMNSSTSSRANGTEIYYSSNNNKTLSNGLSSRLFAKKMLNTLIGSLGSKNRGVKQAGFVVNKYNTVPSILIELGFVSGSSDRKKLKTQAYQKKAAKAIYTGVTNVCRLYPTGR